ncbi:hypothetical protein ACFFTN_12965 [Aminobacter aganoensis]|uniref:Type VI protein secretion system component VasF n=1 Tax=Aminobacter aganoensis TaxID=83264 RepID=A0A7X0F9T3_9HYPH|nr:type VI protein secretion system component VasF [Aminobacter aganoensis]
MEERPNHAMPEGSEHLTLEESKTLARRRRRINWMICALLVAFVVTVYWISFSHVRTETNETQSRYEVDNVAITHA